MFGRPMQVTEVAAADEIAAGASLIMGQADEGLPVVIVRGLAFSAAARPASALVRSREKDKFR
jgi:coenzyme F420-0:L-glutamate ligase / coenzyme F420-1:gamma-L-glutamate ligase